jgi:hypothetical protein
MRAGFAILAASFLVSGAVVGAVLVFRPTESPPAAVAAKPKEITKPKGKAITAPEKQLKKVVEQAVPPIAKPKPIADADQKPKKSLDELKKELRTLRLKEMMATAASIRFGRANELERNLGVEAAKQIKMWGTKNAVPDVIQLAMRIVPEYTIGELKKDGFDVAPLIRRLRDEYFEMFVENPEFNDLLDAQSINEALRIFWASSANKIPNDTN